MQLERKWKIDINTDINETIMERYHISLTWLDFKRLQFPLNPDDKHIIAEATSSRTEEFTPLAQRRGNYVWCLLPVVPFD